MPLSVVIDDEPSTPIKGKRHLYPASIFDIDLLTDVFTQNNIKLIHITNIHRHIIQQGATSFDDIPEIPKAARVILDKDFTFSTSKVVERNDAKDGSTTKLLVELQDGQRIETVIMRYGDVELSTFPQEEKEKRSKELEEAGRTFKSNKRATVCISSQVGCAMGCTFCVLLVMGLVTRASTGTMGLLSNLTVGEIIEQLVHANRVEKIRNVVFMGMGEPLDNYPSVLTSIRMMLDTARFGLSATRITISTVGVVPRIRDLMRDLLKSIIEVTREFIQAQNAEARSGRRHILVEYVLIDGINDSLETARDLGRLLSGMDVFLNVIPYNVTEVPHDYKTPSQQTLREFLEVVRECGVHTLVRQELGSDIASACGQLVIKSAKKAQAGCSDKPTVADLEDLGSQPAKKGGKVAVEGKRRIRHEKGKLTIRTPKSLEDVIGWGASAIVGAALLFVAYRVVNRLRGA
ncbi:hypothetical protein BC829DRAFT_429560 [Chytridium lagenaria]|nr:hypothetical protein BC829DRAFT_429560 [Chytridium lagenaria]